MTTPRRHWSLGVWPFVLVVPLLAVVVHAQLLRPKRAAVAAFEMLSAASAGIPASVTWTRASEAYCPGGLEDSPGGWLANNQPCVNSLGAGIWGASTNRLLRSSELETGSWTKEDVVVTVNVAIAPDGTQTADEVRLTAGLASHRYYQGGMGITSGQPISASAYLKAGTETWINLQHSAGAGIAEMSASLTNGTIGNCTGPPGDTTLSCAMVAVGGGWWRAGLSFTSPNTAGGFFILRGCGGSLANCGTPFTATGTETFYVWGHQDEAGSLHVTPYIRTTGTAATRQADVVSFPRPATVTDAVGCASAKVFIRRTLGNEFPRIFGFGGSERLGLADSSEHQQGEISDGATVTASESRSEMAGRQVRVVGWWSAAAGKKGATTDGYDALLGGAEQAQSRAYDGTLLGPTVYLGSFSGGSSLDGYLSNIKMSNTESGCPQ